MSVSLAQALSEAGCRRLVAAGTCAEYDWDYGFLSEKVTPIRPRTFYGVCKNATREILESYCGQIAMQFAWARFFYLYGPGEYPERLVPTVIQRLLRGERALCSHGNQIRDFLYVSDAASAVAALSHSDVCGPVNIASGNPVSVKQVIETIGDLLDRRELIDLGAVPLPPSEPHLLVADVSRLNDDVGWSPQYDLVAGMKKTTQWWQRQMVNAASVCGAPAPRQKITAKSGAHR